ncbi:MAG: gliding motility-associated C-terminal domain-containing protein [Tannerella sp.]|jgi:gliding motility-associated-like protein|nr:gliding motility-associated C-terminal domain-containing protein [Tannerella sp.]
MQEFKNRKIVWVLLVLLLFIPSAYSQYTVEGGKKEPYLAVDKKPIKVYLVYGMDGVSISYTSSESSHQWYRYKTEVAIHEKVPSTQQGSTSTITNLEEGYGYGVVEGDHYTVAEYIWIIDYSKYPVNIQNLHVNPDVDPCMGFQLAGTDLTPALSYRTLAGVQTEVERKYEVSYNTLLWNEQSEVFISISETDTLTNPIGTSLDEIPLQDTDIDLTGDLYARYFGVEKEYSIDYFEASKVEAHAKAIILSTGTGNIGETTTGSSDESPCDRELYAPTEIRFSAVANTPVASVFKWKLVPPNGRDTLTFMLEEFEYTFNQTGDYKVLLEVSSSRPGKCVDDEYSCSFKITETIMKVPNAFTPVGSPGINDVFKVAYQSVVSFKGWIFNRWGSELFHWNDPSQGWDGKYRGKYVPAGPYFYVIEYTGTDGKKRKKSGDVNVIHLKEDEIITE